MRRSRPRASLSLGLQLLVLSILVVSGLETLEGEYMGPIYLSLSPLLICRFQYDGQHYFFQNTLLWIHQLRLQTWRYVQRTAQHPISRHQWYL